MRMIGSSSEAVCLREGKWVLLSSVLLIVLLNVCSCASQDAVGRLAVPVLSDVEGSDIAELVEPANVGGDCAIESTSPIRQGRPVRHGLSADAEAPRALRIAVRAANPQGLLYEEYEQKWFGDFRIVLLARRWVDDSDRLSHADALELRLLQSLRDSGEASPEPPLWAATAIELAYSCN